MTIFFVDKIHPLIVDLIPKKLLILIFISQIVAKVPAGCIVIANCS